MNEDKRVVSMSAVMRIGVALVAAVLATGVVATLVQSQINFAGLTTPGLPVSWGMRLAVTLEDLARFGPVMAGIAAGGVVPALLIGHALGRRCSARLRVALLAVLAVAGMWTAFAALGLVTPMPALVSATRSTAGLALMSLTGIAGALVYAWLVPAGAALQRGRTAVWLGAGLGLLAVPAVSFELAAPGKAAPVAQVDPASYVIETVAEGLNRPWSVAFLPDGRRLVTEMAGRLRVIAADGAIAEIDTSDLPAVYHPGGMTGFMEVVPDPDFADNALLYFTTSYGTAEANGTRLLRARLDGNRLSDARILFDGTPKGSNGNNGGRLAFLPDGTLVLTVGDGNVRREEAQNLATHLGALVRLHRDGQVPADNPFVNRADAAPEIYSFGHRNPQGIAFDPTNGQLLVSEHGPRGGDELNRIHAGQNYGWPWVTGGIDYSFAHVTPFRALNGYAPPELEWTPAIAPSGLAIYDGQLFEGWQGDLLVPALKTREVRRVLRDNGRIVGEQRWLAELDERIRDVKVAPDGSIHVLTDGENARLLRVVPAQSGG